MLKRIIAGIRGIIMLLWMIFIVLTVVIKSAIFGYNLEWSLKVRRVCMNWCLKILGLQVDLRTTPPDGVFIYCGNHRSYIDPVVVLRDVLALPVGKSEVSKWPIIGYGAKVTGIMWVKRESRNSRRATIEAMRKVLEGGNSVLIYPEGTTHDLPTTIDFKKGAFRLAAEMGIPIVPIAIEYEKMNHAWIGDDTFVPHFLRTFGDWQSNLTMEYGTPIFEKNPQILLEKTKTWIDNKMLEMNGLKESKTVVTK